MSSTRSLGDEPQLVEGDGGREDKIRETYNKSIFLHRELQQERVAIYTLLQAVSEQRYTCYVCQSSVPLSMLVLNDNCRHSVCRVCFVKIIYGGRPRHESRLEKEVAAREATDKRTAVGEDGDGSKNDDLCRRTAERTTKYSGAPRADLYRCLVCAESAGGGGEKTAVPNVLAVLSPGVSTVLEYEHTTLPNVVGYRLQLIDN
jgi:DNA-directed RNA polymerase subunit RPC12/RpoP